MTGQRAVTITRSVSMSGAGLLVVGSVCLSALMAVAATAWRFASTGQLDAQAVAWSVGLVGTAAALLARTYNPEPKGTPADPVVVTPVAPAVPVPLDDAPL